MVKNVDGFDVVSIGEKSPVGCFLEGDLEYLDELHELHSDYLLASKNLLFLAICCQNTVKKLLISMR